MRDKLFISGLFIAGLVALSFIFWYPSTSDLGKYFSLTIIFILSSYVAIGTGILLCILNAFKILIGRYGLLYVFMTQLNFILGIIAITLYFIFQLDMLMFHQGLANLFVGVLMVSNFFLSSLKDEK